MIEDYGVVRRGEDLQMRRRRRRRGFSNSTASILLLGPRATQALLPELEALLPELGLS
jgi:hypothetical protein